MSIEFDCTVPVGRAAEMAVDLKAAKFACLGHCSRGD